MNEYTQRRAFMRRAVELGKKSISEDVKKPVVGVVIVRDGEVLGESFRGETGEGRHAEFGLLDRLKSEGIDVVGATVYSTLEPCSRRNEPKRPCASHLMEAGVSEVCVGIYDPNPEIYREGWKLLNEAGIKLTDFDEDFRDAISTDNAEFIDQYRVAIGERGSAHYDFTQNGGRFRIRHEDLKFSLRTSECGDDSVYIIDHAGNVAALKHAREFAEVDDPGAYDWSNYTRDISVGAIGAIRVDGGYLMVKIVDVKCQNRGATHTEVRFDYEIRRKRALPAPGE